MDLLYFGIALLVGLYLLMWSADKFVDGSSAVATRLGMPKLLVGIIIVGFGTSAPEMLVSALASLGGNPGIALGNAYGSNIANVALILGLTLIICFGTASFPALKPFSCSFFLSVSCISALPQACAKKSATSPVRRFCTKNKMSRKLCR